MVVRMATFLDIDKLIDAVIDREGGYVNHPADRGGPTRWGITQATARADDYLGEMQTYPRERAVAIYQRLYWTRPGLDAVARRYPAVAAELFDIGVNMGTAVGISFLQRCLNAFNDGAKLYRDIIVDGQSGASTLAALDGYRAARGTAGSDHLLEAIRCLRGERYISICESRPANEAFTFGWFGRMVEMLKARFK